MSYQHFEQLYTASEELFKQDIDKTSVSDIINDLQTRLSLYLGVDASDKIPAEEKMPVKIQLFGKILSSLTQLSLKDNINSFTALETAVNNLKLEQLEVKYRV
jgi:hypothetical protein